MTYATMVIAACAKNGNFGRGATRQQIKAYVSENNGGKCVASSVNKAIQAGIAAGNLAQGSTSARFSATPGGRASIKPKKKKKAKK